MARFKHIDTSPRFLAVDLQRQLLPGTVERALNHLIDYELDLFASMPCSIRHALRNIYIEQVRRPTTELFSVS